MKVSVSPEEALFRLKEGNQEFLRGLWGGLDLGFDRRKFLHETGQHPFAVIIGCSDSRVPPELVFHQGLGDLFVVRLAGNALDGAGIGSVEYAVEALGVPLVVVLGHENCGAIQAAVNMVLDEKEATGCLQAVMELLKPYVSLDLKGCGDPRNVVCDRVMELHIRACIASLMSKSESIKEKVKEGTTRILGARYQGDGRVLFWE